MKKCPYCGKEYPDDIERCLIDNELLLGESTEILQGHEEIIQEKPAAVVTPEPVADWSERDIRIFEVILICTIAFGPSILSSLYSLSYDAYSYGGYGRSAFSWLLQSVREGSALALLWYILKRNQKSFSDLGLAWQRRDIGRSVLLYLGGRVAFYVIFELIYFSGLTATDHKETAAHVGRILFGSGVPFIAFLFQFLNPFFEELIVRAYVMTEIRRLTNSATKAVIVSTVLQTSYHFYQGSPAAFAHAGTFLLFSIYYAKTNRVAPIILAHLYSDVGSTLAYLYRF